MKVMLHGMTSEQAQREATAYIRADSLLKRLKTVKGLLTAQEMSTLRGQAIHGDVKGAEKGLDRLLRERL